MSEGRKDFRLSCLPMFLSTGMCFFGCYLQQPESRGERLWDLPCHLLSCTVGIMPGSREAMAPPRGHHVYSRNTPGKEGWAVCCELSPRGRAGKGDAEVSEWTLVQRRGRQRLKACGKSESICRQQPRPLFFRQGWIRRGEGEHEAGSCMRHVFGLRRHVRSSSVCPEKYEIFPCVEESRSGFGAGFSGSLCLEERHAGYFFHCPADFFLILPLPYGRAEVPV